MTARKVLILMGSDSDLGVVRGAMDVLRELGVVCEARVLSVHRAPDDALAASARARADGFGAIICAAGMAAHLGGAVAAKTTLPVIGLPISSGALKGVDALYAIVQMPPGVPVAAVAIDGARNAGILAAQILGVGDEAVAARLEELKKRMRDQVLEKDRKLQSELG